MLSVENGKSIIIIYLLAAIIIAVRLINILSFYNSAKPENTHIAVRFEPTQTEAEQSTVETAKPTLAQIYAGSSASIK